MFRASQRSTALLLVALVVGILKAASASEADEGFASIFNSKDLTGWDGDPRLWSVKEGVIRGETTKENPARGNTFLIWRGGMLNDFELRLRFRIHNGNSGVQVRSRDRGNWVVSGYQVEVAPSKKQMGLFYDEKGRKRLATAGQKAVIDAKGEIKVVGSLGEPEKIQEAYKEKDWNDLVVVGRGNHLIQKINDVVFSEVTDEHEAVRTTSGILALQIHTGPPMVVEFKDIRLKVLKAETSNLKPETLSLKPGASGEVALFNGKDLTGWKMADKYDFADHGKVYVKDGVLYLEEGKPMTGIQWAGEFPTSNYEVSLEAMRVSGGDFFCGMTFPIGDSWATWINGGWGGNIVGLSNVDGYNASENETSLGKSFEDRRWYRFRLRATDEKVECWIDEEKIIDLPRKGHKFEVWEEQSPIKPFGVATWHTGGALRNFTLKRLGK